MADEVTTDYLVIGSGIAGLYFALRAAEHGTVLVVTKKGTDDSATNWAQGGIAAVLGEGDTPEGHVADTLRVGDGLCHREIVELCVEEGPGHVRALAALGVDFARSQDGSFELGREGGHSARRVAHHKDTTGAAIQAALSAAVARHSQIRVMSDHIAVDLLSMAKYGGEPACFGAYVLDTRSGEVTTVVARATVLATGGAGKIYMYTSNPDVATGDGIAMAYRIGAPVANLEFVQFHPTVLYHPHAKSFLISETLRGEGGVLRLADGSTFMERYHELKSLAPRDVVARAIDNELKRSGADSVFLDMTHLDGDFVRTRFPTIFERCLALGIDITRQPIPVVPAAHYQCGGVVTDARGRRGPPDRAGPAAERGAVDSRQRHRLQRRHRGRAQLGRGAPLHVVVSRHRALRQAHRARPPPHPAPAPGDQRVLLGLPGHLRRRGAAQPGAGRPPHHRERAPAQGVARPALHAGLPGQGRALATGHGPAPD